MPLQQTSLLIAKSDAFTRTISLSLSMYNASYLPQRWWGNFTTIVYFGNKNWEIGNGECIRIPASVDASLPSDGHYLGRGDGARVLPDDDHLGLERLGDCRRVVCRATDVVAPAVVRVKPPTPMASPRDRRLTSTPWGRTRRSGCSVGWISTGAPARPVEPRLAASARPLRRTSVVRHSPIKAVHPSLSRYSSSDTP